MCGNGIFDKKKTKSANEMCEWICVFIAIDWSTGGLVDMHHDRK